MTHHSATFAASRRRPFAILRMRGGTWVVGRRLRRRAPAGAAWPLVPLLGAALSAVALALGATYALDRMNRGERRAAAADPRDWAKRLRGGDADARAPTRAT